tara:strand:- start:254 stop:913 length:660 start_codon:yes stop_codon:yes gene_type:complete
MPETPLKSCEYASSLKGCMRWFVILGGLLLIWPSDRWLAESFDIATPILWLFFIKFWVVLIFLCLCGSVFFWGSTLISIKLNGKRRTQFQILVILVTPMIFSLYFINEASALTANSVFLPLLSWWTLLPIAILFHFGWFGSELLHSEHPFRGFVIAAFSIFMILGVGYNGGFSSDYGDVPETLETDSASAYLGRFLSYICVFYFSMYLRMKVRNHPFLR